ncbi:hypothetical protein PVAP13_1NG130400 [Panicum virgatum]|uniref:Uncharacterized protein n=1 Tax=Panicum virgatum TaxID=38727 RepID=A0A8T0WVU1_PANVG|nr:hypothetical protein PVAP13_1NG130400 [Panicum virgatum]
MQCLDVVVPGRGGLLAAARRAPRLLGTLFTRHRIAVRIRELKARARDLGERRLRYDVSIRDGGTSRGVHPAPVEKGDDVEARRRALDDVTNFLNDDIREVICWLTKELPDQDPQRQLRVVAVVRRQYQEDEYPLARKVYEHPSLSRRFDFKAWINGTGTQYTKRQEALLCVLQQLRVPLVSDITDEKKLAEKLRDHLRGKRFLITAANDPYGSVRAAVESACTTDLLSFPPGSAILVTTWLPPPREPPPPYQVKNYLEIVYFFYDKAVMLVGGHGCDIVIKEILRKIMMRRGWNFYSMEMFLRALYMNPNRSREELQNLLDRLTPPTIAERIMEYCYNDLPSHYKTCLLYLSILFGKTNGGESGSPMDSNVKRTTIVRRLVAENFITMRDERGATDEAERCVHDLLLRGLLRPVHVGADGKVKSCTVHHRVLAFITKMAQEEGLVDVGTQLPPDLACRLSIRNGISRQQLQLVEEKKKKKKKHQKEVPQSTTRWKRLAPMDSSEGSKLAVQVDDTEAFLESLPISPPLGLLQVLDLEGFKGLRRHHLRDICNKMFQLKYLSLRSTAVTELPKDIEKLRYLETLDIRQTRIRTFTTKAIVLPKLVHLLAGQVENQGCGVKRFVSTAHMPRGIGSMTDLQILCHVVVSSSADELVEVGRLQQLRKLGLVLRGKEARLSHFLRVIERLNESLRSLSVKIELNSSKTPDLSIGKMAFSPPRLLESLTINGRITGLPIWIKDLSALVKIALHGTSLMDNAIRMLGELVRLRCLRILHGSYIESRLIIKDGEFQNLNYLLVEGSEVTNIHFGSRAAPKLEKIVWAFTKMETISGIKRLESLKEIELHGDCNPYSIIKDMAEHKNHPVVIHNANHEATN